MADAKEAVATKRTARTTDVQISTIDQTLRRLPDGAEPLASIHDATAKSVLKLAEKLVEDARTRLGPVSTKPRIIEVARLFFDHAGEAPGMNKQLNQVLRQPERIEQVAQLDETWDKAFAGAINTFDQTSIESGSKVQEAEDNWRLAVRVYESEARTAGAIFRAEIEKAKTLVSSRGGSHPHVDEHVDYYAQAAEIGDGLVKYEQAMAKATGELATALGTLIKDLFDSSTAVSVAEATLIATTQTASSTFWTGVHSELDNRS